MLRISVETFLLLLLFNFFIVDYYNIKKKLLLNKLNIINYYKIIRVLIKV